MFEIYDCAFVSVVESGIIFVYSGSWATATLKIISIILQRILSPTIDGRMLTMNKLKQEEQIL